MNRSPVSILMAVVALTSLVFGLGTVAAQENMGLAATLEVLSPGVEVLRVGTTNWIAVNMESIVGTGDTIRTDAGGRARVTFFADGTATQVLQNTEYVITEFSGTQDSFTLIMSVVLGQTVQTLGRVLDISTNYEVSTPAMSLAARGTAFAVRVEPNGRSAMLVSEGLVEAQDEAESAAVPPSYGIRGDVAGELSDVVQATSFDQLDAALDGCTAQINIADDVSYNVRALPTRDSEIIATFIAVDIDRLYGMTETSGWYRVQVGDVEGWIFPSSVAIDDGCAGLRIFPNTGQQEETPVDTSQLILPHAI